MVRLYMALVLTWWHHVLCLLSSWGDVGEFTILFLHRIIYLFFACKGKHGTRCSPPLFITTSILHAHRLYQKEKETFRRKDIRICLIGLESSSRRSTNRQGYLRSYTMYKNATEEPDTDVHVKNMFWDISLLSSGLCKCLSLPSGDMHLLYWPS